jgi:hypothetical protein
VLLGGGCAVIEKEVANRGGYLGIFSINIG